MRYYGRIKRVNTETLSGQFLFGLWNTSINVNNSCWVLLSWSSWYREVSLISMSSGQNPYFLRVLRVNVTEKTGLGQSVVQSVSFSLYIVKSLCVCVCVCVCWCVCAPSFLSVRSGVLRRLTDTTVNKTFKSLQYMYIHTYMSLRCCTWNSQIGIFLKAHANKKGIVYATNRCRGN